MLALVLLIIAPSSGFIAYDCDQLTPITSYSMVDLPTCATNNYTVRSAFQEEATLLEIPKVTKIPATVCQVLQRELRMYCSYSGYVSEKTIPENDLDYNHVLITERDCLDLVEGKTIRLGETDLRGSRGAIQTSLTGRGVRPDGFCDNYQQHIAVYHYKVVLQEIVMEVHRTSRGSINAAFVDMEQVTLGPSSSSGSLSPNDRVIWDSSYSSSIPWVVHHQGITKGVNYTDGTSMRVIPEIFSAVEIQKPCVIDGLKVYETNLPQIFYHVGINIHPPPVAGTPVIAMSSLIKSGLQMTMEFSKELNEAYYSTLKKALCFQEITIIREILHTGKDNPDGAGYRMMGEPGWSAVAAGAVIHLSKCTPLNVTIRQVETCFNRIPIEVQTRADLLFMDPLTWTLKASARNISCESLELPQFKLRGKWYSLNPRFHEVPKPSVVQSKIEDITMSKIVVGKLIYEDHLIDDIPRRSSYRSKDDLVSNVLLDSVGHAPDVKEYFASLGNLSWVSHQLRVLKIFLVASAVLAALIGVTCLGVWIKTTSWYRRKTGHKNELTVKYSRPGQEDKVVEAGQGSSLEVEAIAPNLWDL